MNKIYVVVKWSSDSEKDCNVLGTFLDKNTAIDFLINYFGELFEWASDACEVWRPYLVNNLTICPCDYYKICEETIDEPRKELSNPFIPIVEERDNSFKVLVYTHKGYRRLDIRNDNDKLSVQISPTEWTNIKFHKGKTWIKQTIDNKSKWVESNNKNIVIV